MSIVIDSKQCYINIDGDSMKRKYFLILLIMLGVFVFTGCDKNDKTKLVENKDYFVRGKFEGKYLDITKRGYYVDTLDRPNAPYLYIICMGEKRTGGYGLEIKEVKKIDEKVEIIVEEIEPSNGVMVSMVLTYPTIIVEFPKYQKNIIIKNTKGKEFSKLKDY